MFLIPDQKELKERRKAAGFSMKKLSQQAGLPDNAVLRIETGKTKKMCIRDRYMNIMEGFT